MFCKIIIKKIIAMLWVMDINDSIYQYYEKTKKFYYLNLESDKFDINSFINKINFESSFNPVFWITRRKDMKIKITLNHIDKMNKIESIIPFFYIEISPLELKYFLKWHGKTNFFDYLRIIPAIYINIISELGTVFQILSDSAVYNIAFDFSHISNDKIFEFLDKIKKEKFNEGVIIFLKSDILEEPYKYKLSHYEFPIYLKPAEYDSLISQEESDCQ